MGESENAVGKEKERSHGDETNDTALENYRDDVADLEQEYEDQLANLRAKFKEQKAEAWARFRAERDKLLARLDRARNFVIEVGEDEGDES